MPAGPVRATQQFIARAIVDTLIGDPGDFDPEGIDLEWSCFEPFGSSAIERVCHRLRTGDLTVRFANRPGSPDYFFPNVPRELYRQWKRVGSAGRFYHRRIAGQF